MLAFALLFGGEREKRGIISIVLSVYTRLAI